MLLVFLVLFLFEVDNVEVGVLGKRSMQAFLYLQE